MRIGRTCRIVAIALGVALLGCGGEPAVGPRLGHGVIRGVDAERGAVTIEHGEIPDLMMAMTMTFSVDDSAILANLSVGDAVDFVVEQDGDRYVVRRIDPAQR